MSRSIRVILLCAGAALALSGCAGISNLNPFAEKEKPLPGERRPVFGPNDPYGGPRKLPPPNSGVQGPSVRAGEPSPTTAPTPPPAQ